MEVAEVASAAKVRSGPTAADSAVERELRDLAALFDGPESRERPRAEGAADIAARALEAALIARSPDLGASAALTRRIAATLGMRIGLRGLSLVKLGLATQVRDAGMIALPDHILRPDAPLAPEDWGLINRHPIVSADLCSELASLAALAEIVLCHHERWDGQGYPNGLSRDAIPVESRVIAVADAFTAIALGHSRRPGMGTEAALEQIGAGAGTQFDPAIADALASVNSLAAVTPIDEARPVEQLSSRRGPRFSPSGDEGDEGRSGLRDAIAGVQLVAALAPAQERLLAQLDAAGGLDSDLVAIIESDVGLTLAVLRDAQGHDEDAPSVSTVPQAVSVLGRDGVRASATSVPVSEFHWGTSRAGSVLQRFRIHALAVARAAASLSREAG